MVACTVPLPDPWLCTIRYILKGVAHAAFGHLVKSTSELQKAQQYFHLIGSSASECDTIPGRQAMASYSILMGQFDDALIYLSSIQTYFADDDTFV